MGYPDPIIALAEAIRNKQRQTFRLAVGGGPQAEIALAILAEMVEVRHGGTAKSQSTARRERFGQTT